MSGARFGQKFNNFNIIQAIYKTVDGHDIRADILSPVSLDTTKKIPVIARFHGGGLVCDIFQLRSLRP
jgi:acetyl esterase/lipase